MRPDGNEGRYIYSGRPYRLHLIRSVDAKATACFRERRLIASPAEVLARAIPQSMRPSKQICKWLIIWKFNMLNTIFNGRSSEKRGYNWFGHKQVRVGRTAKRGRRLEPSLRRFLRPADNGDGLP